MSGVISGIYRIVCVKNGRYYFGSSKDIWRRWRQHQNQLRKEIHGNPIVQQSWNKHGGNTFRINLVEEVEENCLLEVEQQYLNEHIGKSNCMNIAKDALSPMRGRKFSEISLNKLKNRVPWNKGTTGLYSEEHRRAIGAAHKGKIISAETRKKMSDSRLGSKNPFYGKTHSLEARKKMSEVNKGNQHAKGYKHTTAARVKMSKAANQRKAITGSGT